MSLKCPDCNRILSSQSYLDLHQRKTIPCNFQCRLCPFIGKDRFAFSRHQRKNHCLEIDESEDEDLEPSVDSRRRISLEIVPLEDFNAQTLRDTMRKYASNVQQTRVQRNLINGEAGVGTDVAEVDTIITTYHIRANDLREMIPDDLLISVIKSFQIDTSTRRIFPIAKTAPLVSGQLALTARQMDIQRRMQPELKPHRRSPQVVCDNVSEATNQISDLLFSILNGVHGSENKRLHSICIGDMARKNVNFYSRTPLGDKTYWQTNSKELSIRKLQSHVKELYRFIIEAVVGTLKPCFLNTTKDFIWALKTNSEVFAISAEPLIGVHNNVEEPDILIQAMNNLFKRQTAEAFRTSDHETTDQSTRTREPGEGTRVSVTMLRPEDVTDCLDDDYLEERKDLSDLIQVKKNQLHFKLNQIELDPRKCLEFLDETYPICVGTLRSTRP